MAEVMTLLKSQEDTRRQMAMRAAHPAEPRAEAFRSIVES